MTYLNSYFISEIVTAYRLRLFVLLAFIAAWITPVLAATDINATYIERTPRYDYDAVKNMPTPGDSVTFHGHIVNWSDTTEYVDYLFLIDDELYYEDTIELSPGEEGIVTIQWEWEDGEHLVEFIVDPYNNISEDSEDNNYLADRTDALIAGFWVEQSLYDYFHTHQHALGIGSNSWQDWIQRQMARQNELYEDAIWPISPNGVLDRVRIDKIIVVPDGALPLNGGLPTNNPDSSDKTVDLMWGFPAMSVAPGETFYANHTSIDENNHFYIEQPLIHELGHARYLIDSYGFDVHNTDSHHAVQIWEGDIYVAGSEYMPFLAWGEVLYYNKSGGVMSGPYGFTWSPYEAGALNLIAHQRATCGNSNSPCNRGVYLQDLPDNNHVRFIETTGSPWVNANVRIYQATAGPPSYGKTIDNTPDQQYYTDTNGYIHLPRNPFNPGGSIIHTRGHANGVFVFRIEYPGQIWYRVMEVSDFNMQYWQGNTSDAYYSIELINRLDNSPPTDPNNLTATVINHDAVLLSWDASTDDIGVKGYYVYRDGIQIGTTSEPGYIDTHVDSCSTYTYTVRAYDLVSQSNLSNEYIAEVPAMPQTADLNNDLIVDIADLMPLCANWLQSNCGIQGDMTGDSKVNLLDFAKISQSYGNVTDIDNWQMKQHDMHNTGRAYFNIPAARLNNTFFDNILWQKPTPNSPDNGNVSGTSMSFFSQVGPNGEDVVVGTYHWPKGVQGMDRHTGKKFWYGNTAGGESIADMAPAFSNNGQTVYVTSDATTGRLMAFDTAVGPVPFWDTSADAGNKLDMVSPTISPDGRIWLHAWNDRPYAAIDSGTQINTAWSASSEVLATYSDPALYKVHGQLRVISGGRNGLIKCWDGTTQAELWSTATNAGMTDATPTIDPDNGNIYISSGENDIYVIGLDKEGQPLWSSVSLQVHDYQSGVNNPQCAQAAGCLSHDGSTYYFQTNSNQGDGKLYAINTTDGTVKWLYPTNSRGWEIHSSSPIVTQNGVVIVGNNENDMYYAIRDTAGAPALLDTLTVDAAGVAQASATLSADGKLYLPLRIEWTQSNGDNDTPSSEIENLFTAFNLKN